MASFECKVYSVIIKPHPNADVLELAQINDYLSIVPKDKFKDGDKVVYIPEQAIVPEDILKELGLEGKLSGKQKNRVKAMKLRGILSQGLVYKAKPEWELGQDVKDELNIEKYEPPIPTNMSGEVDSWELKVKFDIENIKKYPNIFQENEPVVFTEKIHGTCTIATFVPESKKDLRKESMADSQWAIISKGLAQQQLYFKENESNKNNLYLKAFNKEIREKLESEFKDSTELVTFFGESFGPVQDLKYGYKDCQLRLFGIKEGDKFWDFDKLEALCQKLSIPLVPVLYKGPFSKEVLLKYTNGKEQVSGQELHIREGIVVYPQHEREDLELGRVILKSVSDDYLGRKKGTEFN